MAKPNVEPWQAEQDARTLLDAETIKGDKARLQRAKPKIRSLAVEKKKEAIAAAKTSRKLGGTQKPRRHSSSARQKR